MAILCPRKKLLTILNVFNTSEISLFSGTISAETDFPLHGVSSIFVIWKYEVFCGKYSFQITSLTVFNLNFSYCRFEEMPTNNFVESR